MTFDEGTLYTGAWFKRINNIVFVRINAATSKYVQGVANYLGTITDADFIPSQSTIIPCSANSGGGANGIGFIVIGTDGKVYYYPITNGGNWVSANGCYII